MSSLYLDEALTDVDLSVGSSVTIAGSEAHHAVSVSRLREGEHILIGNGAGTRAEATVTEVSTKSFTCVVTTVETQERPAPQLVLVQALAKGDRDERAVESSTEVGVDAIYPFQAMRSVSRWNVDKIEKGRARWQKVAREASKQSLRHWVPTVEEPLTLAALVELARQQLVLVLEPSASRQLSSLSREELFATQRVLLVVGPEGGFDDRELEALIEAGAQQVRLGETVLRTSTAGVAALSVLNATLSRW